MQKIKHIFTAICIALCLISLSVVLTLNFQTLYYMDVKLMDLPEKTGYTEEEIRENYDTLIEYNSVFYQGELEFPTLAMSESGRIHFEEVKNVFVFFEAMLFPITFLFSAVCIFLLRKEKPLYLKLASYFMVGIPAVLGAFIAINWDRVFVLFHELVFRNDYWIFDPAKDPVINILPDAFFMHCAILILLFVVLFSVLCMQIYKGGNMKYIVLACVVFSACTFAGCNIVDKTKEIMGSISEESLLEESQLGNGQPESSQLEDSQLEHEELESEQLEDSSLEDLESTIKEDASENMQTESEGSFVYYHEKYSLEQVIEYFCDVVSGTEYSTGDGDAKLVQKWTEPIYYQMQGEWTAQDQQILENLFSQLNCIYGFPGIYPASEGNLVNLRISFYERDAFQADFGEFLNYEEADGAVQYWYYNDLNNIYEARIGYRTDLSQYIRNGVLLEEVVNGLGIQDTMLREDSIVYQSFSEVQELSEMDWLLIKLLYHPEIKCGMTPEECKQVLERIY